MTTAAGRLKCPACDWRECAGAD